MFTNNSICIAVDRVMRSSKNTCPNDKEKSVTTLKVTMLAFPFLHYLLSDSGIC